MREPREPRDDGGWWLTTRLIWCCVALYLLLFWSLAPRLISEAWTNLLSQ